MAIAVRKQPNAAPRPPDAGAPELSPALRQALAAIPTGEDRGRFVAFFEAAAVAIDALGELDFARYEKEEIGTADLSVWEALAPVIRDTIVDVNALLTVVKERLPGPAAVAGGDADAAFDEMFGEAPAAAAPAPRPAAAPRGKVDEAAGVIHAIAGSLAREVTAFGEGIRKPVVMADRWNLLAHLSEFRGKFRAGIGEMVFQGAQAFAPVRKEEVVPGYHDEIDEAVQLRRTLAVLAGLVRAENEKLQGEGPAEARLRALRLLRDVDTFRRSQAWGLLRPGDKRSFIQARGELATLANDVAAKPKALKLAVEGLDKFLDSLSVINRRETLTVHDREALAAAALGLERAELALPDASRAAAELAGGLGAAQRLYGRDRALDGLLRSLRRLDVAALSAPQLRAVLDAVRARIAQVPPP